MQRSYGVELPLIGSAQQNKINFTSSRFKTIDLPSVEANSNIVGDLSINRTSVKESNEQNRDQSFDEHFHFLRRNAVCWFGTSFYKRAQCHARLSFIAEDLSSSLPNHEAISFYFYLSYQLISFLSLPKLRYQNELSWLDKVAKS